MIRVQKINVFGDAGVDVVNQSVNQFIEFMAGQENIVEAALMPDCHLGYSVPIGSVFSSDGVIYPSAVGYDIGCGMCAIKTTFDPEAVRKNAKEIFEEIYSRVPVGFNHSSRDANWDERYGLSVSSVTKAIFEKNGLRQLGTLGGGNHFIEVGQDQEGSVWIVVHSGSRNVGHSVATHYMRLASGTGKAKEGPFGFDVNSANGKDYAIDLNFCLRFALENRQQIIENVFEAIRRYTQGFLLWNTFINRNHNHAEEKGGLWIHRKGATHAEEGMFGVIPGNMRDGSFIVLGKGNPNSLCSSSHGAGRVLGRRQANEKLSLDDFTRTMRDAKVTARTDRNTLDESPLAYKDIFEVMELQKDLVDVVAHVRPIINVKG